MCGCGCDLQVGFFEVVVLPMFRSLVTVLPGAQVMLDAVSDNYMMWRQRPSLSGSA